MSATLPLELGARILWRTGRLLRFLKWPSAHEVDFGAFLVEFDFKQGLIFTRYADGSTRKIGGFSPQKRGTSITSIVGPISVGDDYHVELHPATAESAASIHCARIQNVEWKQKLQMDTVEWGVDDCVRILSAVEGRDAFLKIFYTEEAKELALVLASLIVFLRFSV